MYLLEYLTALTLEQMVFFVFLPFITIFAIFWGILGGMRIFGQRVSLVLTLAMSLIIVSTESFVVFSTFLMELGALTGVVAFAGVFFIGVIFWAFGRGKEFYDEAMNYEEKLRRIEREIEKLDRKYDETKDPSIQRTIQTLENKRRMIEREVYRR